MSHWISIIRIDDTLQNSFLIQNLLYTIISIF